MHWYQIGVSCLANGQESLQHGTVQKGKNAVLNPQGPAGPVKAGLKFNRYHPEVIEIMRCVIPRSMLRKLGLRHYCQVRGNQLK